MENLFLFLLNNSITAGYLVLAVLLLRPLLKNAPKYIRCILWSFVGLRLMVPFSVESVFSLIPSSQPIPQDILYTAQPAIETGIPIFNSTVNPILSDAMAPDIGASVNPMQIAIHIAGYLWLTGVVVMALYGLWSYVGLRRKLREAVREQNNIWLCDRIPSAFLLGIIKPRIYLPSALPEKDREYVIAHENAHIRRKDHWWKPLGFLLLTVYWFHPLMWVAYIFLCRDIEFACDEKVIRELGIDSKKPYSEALIHASVSRKMISACPVAFGEDGVKGRIRSVLHYKKPAFWMILISLLVCIMVAVCFLTNPPGEESFVAKYETGKCLYSYMVSAEKETQTNPVTFDIHGDLQVYRQSGEEVSVLGKLSVSDYSKDDLNTQLIAQGGKKLHLGQIENAFEILDASGNRQYVFFQKPNGKIISVSFFTDGKIMNVFQLTNTGACNRIHFYSFRAEVLEVQTNSLLVSPLGGEEIAIADRIVVTIPAGWPQSFEPGDRVEINYDGTVQEVYPPVLPNVYGITNTKYFSSFIGTSDLQASYNGLLEGTEYDIDGDGITENLVISPGPTSGLFTFVVTAYENVIPEYSSIFCTEWFDYGFRTEPDGTVVIAGTGNQDKEFVYHIRIDNGTLVLSDGKENAALWSGANSLTLSEIRENYPQYLNLPTGKGLEVYVWYNGTWRCGVRGGTNRNAEISELHAFRAGTSLEEMAIILGTYRLPIEDIAILYTYNPAFSGENPTPPTDQQQTYIAETLSVYLPVKLPPQP